MNIEIVNVYEQHRDDAKKRFQGTMHIKIALCNNVVMHLKGILVKRKGDKWFFANAVKYCTNPVTGRIDTYPTFSFDDVSLGNRVHEYLCTQGRSYMQAWLRNNEPTTDYLRSCLKPKLDKPFGGCNKLY